MILLFFPNIPQSRIVIVGSGAQWATCFPRLEMKSRQCRGKKCFLCCLRSNLFFCSCCWRARAFPLPFNVGWIWTGSGLQLTDRAFHPRVRQQLPRHDRHVTLLTYHTDALTMLSGNPLILYPLSMAIRQISRTWTSVTIGCDQFEATGENSFIWLKQETVHIFGVWPWLTHFSFSTQRCNNASAVCFCKEMCRFMHVRHTSGFWPLM